MWNEIIGLEATTVTFIRDYIQIVFEGNKVYTLTMFTLPIVTVEFKQHREGDMLYANVLIATINHIVQSVDIQENRKLTVVLDSGVTLEVSLRDGDLQYGNAILLSDGKDMIIL